MASNPVVWFEIYVQDIDKAKTFYSDVLEIEFTRLGPPDVEMWAFPSAGENASMGCSGTLIREPGMASGANSTLVYFGCDDCAVEAGRVKAAGGLLEREKMSIGEFGFVALARDTEGNMFGLHSLK